MVGVPPIAWSMATAKTVLGASAWVERLGTETASMADLGSFRVTAWTNNPAAIPRSKELWLAEPLVFSEEDDDLLLPVEALIPEEVALLEFQAVVHLVRVEDTAASADRSSVGGGHDGGSDSGGDDGGDLGAGPSARGPRQLQFSCARGVPDAGELASVAWQAGAAGGAGANNFRLCLADPTR